MTRRYVVFLFCIASVLVSAAAVQLARADRAAAGSSSSGPLVVYSGRSKSLVDPLMAEFTKKTGIAVDVRYAGSTEMANLLLEEGGRTPADVFFSQDPGALGAVAAKGMLAPLPSELLARVDEAYRSPKGEWVGVTGRSRVIAWSTARLAESALPASVDDLTDPKWKGRVGWAPSNASFQLFVTAMRHTRGDEETRAWLLAMKDNGVKDYKSNRPILQAIADGEIDLGLVNHYYLHGFLKDQGKSFPVANLHPAGDIGGMMSVAGVAILSTTKNQQAARRFVEFLLSDDAKTYFVEETGEYGLAGGLSHPEGVPAPAGPDGLRQQGVDLGSLSDLRETLDMLRATNVLP